MKKATNFKKRIEQKILLLVIGIFFSFNSNAQLDVTTGGTVTSPKNISFAPIYIHGDVSTGVYVGHGNTVGTTTNIALGSQNTLSTATGTGSSNLAIGNSALNTSTTDFFNLAIGNNSMQYLNTGAGNNNIAIGLSALKLKQVPGTGFTNYSSNNIAIGHSAMANSTNQTSLGTSYNTDNIAIGNTALLANRGQFNIAVGSNVMASNTTGVRNVALGYQSLESNTGGTGNVALGQAAIQGANPGAYNIGISYQSLNNITNAANHNIGIGYQALNLLTSGSKNVGIGYQVQVPVATNDGQLSIQNIIYGVGNIGTGTIVSNGSIGIGIMPVGTTALPTGVYATNTVAKLHIGGTLRLDKTVTNFSTAPVQAKYLFVDAQGMVAEAPAPAAMPDYITANCTALNAIPRITTAGSPNMSCSQITDDGTTTVQIGTLGASGPIQWNPATASGVGAGTANGWITGAYTGNPTISTAQDYKLVVNGMVRGLAFISTSDERLKKNIKKIESPIKKISKFNGYTYNWEKNNFAKVKLDDSRQSGFLAQEIVKVLPEAVVINSDGVYGVNYNAIMPLLTEGIKEQQIQIESQQSKIEKLELENENFKLQLTVLKNKFNQLTTGDVKIKLSSLKVIPNPMTGVSVVSYKLDNANAVSVLIISDLQGKLFKQIGLIKNQQQGQVQVSKKDLPNGMYVFTIVSNNAEVQSKKVLVSE